MPHSKTRRHSAVATASRGDGFVINHGSAYVTRRRDYGGQITRMCVTVAVRLELKDDLEWCDQ